MAAEAAAGRVGSQGTGGGRHRPGEAGGLQLGLEYSGIIASLLKPFFFCFAVSPTARRVQSPVSSARPGAGPTYTGHAGPWGMVGAPSPRLQELHPPGQCRVPGAGTLALDRVGSFPGEGGRAGR